MRAPVDTRALRARGFVDSKTTDIWLARRLVRRDAKENDLSGPIPTEMGLLTAMSLL